ncbi:hypothetical protein [Dyadobacter frigoris]|uniref:Uncharacterized protein n=1 Tax=Dyadobacter frigoris TaxID=2576211 RepID=A0A4U6DA08_9BACT|nr:hypothetical protein [Dyadobacter frigoris]TKT93525.1 hypothetical protein FDK13_06695 [Dyadobacter frigoris]
MKTALKFSALVLVSFLFASCAEKEINPESVYYYQSPESPSGKPGAGNVLDIDLKITAPRHKAMIGQNGSVSRSTERTPDDESENTLNQ